MSGIIYNDPAFTFNYTGNTITSDYLVNNGQFFTPFTYTTGLTNEPARIFNFTGTSTSSNYTSDLNQNVNSAINTLKVVSYYLTGIGNSTGATSCNTMITTLNTFLT